MNGDPLDVLADLFGDDGERGTLRAVLQQACLDTGSRLADLTVLSAQVDPYRLDTPAFHADGAWLAEQMVALRLAERRIHLRGLHYALVSTSGLVKPNGEPYRNTEKDWLWLQSGAAKAARWLGYVRFDQITDERNSPPVIKVKGAEPVETFVYIGDGITIRVPDEEDMKPTVGVSNFGARQPYHLVIYGEKTSLADVLSPLCDRYDADLYLPSGEISDTLLHQMAKVGADDGRPMVLLVLADFDPSGNQMAVSIGRKLQAFRDLHFRDLEFELRPVALTEEQVREFDLPSTPLKETERRADGWRAAHGGLEQTEIDALATLKPHVLTEIVRDAITPFYDSTLASRTWEAKDEWEDYAQATLDQLINTDLLSQLREQALDKLAGIQAEIDAINETLRAETSTLGLELPMPIAPEPELPDRDIGKPLVSSAWSWADQTRALIARKHLLNGAAS
jgi:hypothetical protein